MVSVNDLIEGLCDRGDVSIHLEAYLQILMAAERPDRGKMNLPREKKEIVKKMEIIKKTREKKEVIKKITEEVCSSIKRRAIRPPRLNLPQGWILRRVVARLRTRGLAGVQLLPWNAILSMGLFWDPILQLPYYPASTVKGGVHSLLSEPEVVAEAVSRAARRQVRALEALAEALVILGVSDWRQDVEKVLDEAEVRREERAELQAKVREGLGSRGLSLSGEASEWCWAGSVVFFDAYPVSPGESGLLLVPEVMTPHYRELEASHHEEPGFAEHKASPTPLIFLAVERGTKFEFQLAGRSEEDLDIAQELLKEALRRGLGAKTTSGYNLFDVEA